MRAEITDPITNFYFLNNKIIHFRFLFFPHSHSKGRIIAGVESSTAKHIPIVNQPSPSLVLINNPTDTTPLVTTVTTPATPLTTSDNMELPKLDGPSTPLVSIHDQIAVNIPPVDVDFDNSHASDIPEELKPFIPEGPLLSTDSKLSNKQHRRDTSDDTESIESRPNKRDVSTMAS
uniref:Uncharacterized protein n=1 Tax=Rhizophagus irregularis (strain DAOM 181602 / DAOM 197198 / MUCL 43194) TaxID=747089 RepID=U9SWC1_RHIID